MAKLIKNGQVINDDWQLLPKDTEEGSELPSGRIIVPLRLWQQCREELLKRGDCAVWLDSDQEATALTDDFDHLPLIAINFPAFTDGRGFSTAHLLRDRYGYRGELRAVGSFIRDQLFYLKRCGFCTFALETSDPEAALPSLQDFSVTYQAASDQSLPLFRRH